MYYQMILVMPHDAPEKNLPYRFATAIEIWLMDDEGESSARVLKSIFPDWYARHDKLEMIDAYAAIYDIDPQSVIS